VLARLDDLFKPCIAYSPSGEAARHNARERVRLAEAKLARPAQKLAADRLNTQPPDTGHRRLFAARIDAREQVRGREADRRRALESGQHHRPAPSPALRRQDAQPGEMVSPTRGRWLHANRDRTLVDMRSPRSVDVNETCINRVRQAAGHRRA
jgi:hypothetical protein